jgi:ribonuclease VapC
MITALLRKLNAEIVDFNEYHYEAAASAFLRFGKGRHPAGLNFGDCMSYALSAVTGLPLLCTGDDFARTDIQCA